MYGSKTKNNNSSKSESELWRNAGPSAFQLHDTMLKSDKIWCAYLVANPVSLRTFWTPLVLAYQKGERSRMKTLPRRVRGWYCTTQTVSLVCDDDDDDDDDDMQQSQTCVAGRASSKVISSRLSANIWIACSLLRTSTPFIYTAAHEPDQHHRCTAAKHGHPAAGRWIADLGIMAEKRCRRTRYLPANHTPRVRRTGPS